MKATSKPSADTKGAEKSKDKKKVQEKKPAATKKDDKKASKKAAPVKKKEESSDEESDSDEEEAKKAAVNGKVRFVFFCTISYGLTMYGVEGRRFRLGFEL